MGHTKMKMRFQEKKKSRMVTFKKRKDSMMRKLQELATLCDVGACMIIYDPDQETTSIWPPEKPDEVRRLINAYKRNSGRIKSRGVSDFFAERRREVEEETLKMRKKKGKYPTWDDRLMFMNESQLRGLDAALQFKAEIVRSRIHFLKQTSSLNSNFTQFQEINPSAMDYMHCSSRENLGYFLNENLNNCGHNGDDMIQLSNLGDFFAQNLNYCAGSGDYMIQCSSMKNLGWMDQNVMNSWARNGDDMIQCSSMENLVWMDQNLINSGARNGDDMIQYSNLGWIDQNLMNSRAGSQL